MHSPPSALHSLSNSSVSAPAFFAASMRSCKATNSGVSSGECSDSISCVTSTESPKETAATPSSNSRRVRGQATSSRGIVLLLPVGTNRYSAQLERNVLVLQELGDTLIRDVVGDEDIVL